MSYNTNVLFVHVCVTIHTVSTCIVTRGAITSIQHSKSYTCTVLHGPEATTRYYGAEPAPTVASHAQQLNFLLSSTIDNLRNGLATPTQMF